MIEKLIVTLNTILPEHDFKLPQGFMDWKNWANANKEFKISKLMKRACPSLSIEDQKNYDLPFEKTNHGAALFVFLIYSNLYTVKKLNFLKM